jgi:predicted transcriptional regulator
LKKSVVAGRPAIYMPEHPAANNRGYILEHRYVVEQYLGRILKENEHVHHRNGDKFDNRLENLQIVSRSEHAKIHYKEGHLKSPGRGRTLPYSEIEELIKTTNWGHKKIAKELGLSRDSVRYAYNKMKHLRGR